MTMKESKAYFRGCLLGGATGDAKGYGVRENGKDLISDNTQMTIFTVDGLIWSKERAKRRGMFAYIPCLFYSYQKWYYSQTGNLADKSYEFLMKGEILEWEELFARRGKGMTSMTALAGSINNKFGTLVNRINSSKGCGSVMRVAPIGMYFIHDEDMAFRIGCESGALTHGHIDAILSAGFMAHLIAKILQGEELHVAVEQSLEKLRFSEEHETCSEVIERAVHLAKSKTPIDKATEQIGEGYTADEAVALAVYMSLRFENDFDAAIRAATSFKGNLDSIAPLCGNILGAYLGETEIPFKWVRNLELADLIVHGSDLLLSSIEEDDK
jgi:ADP-ribosylglycohydrolase